MNPDNINDKVGRSKYLHKPYNSEAPTGRNYVKLLNENVGSIIKETRKNVKDNFELREKQDEIDKFSGEYLLYNNPRNLTK